MQYLGKTVGALHALVVPRTSGPQVSPGCDALIGYDGSHCALVAVSESFGEFGECGEKHARRYCALEQLAQGVHGSPQLTTVWSPM